MIKQKIQEEIITALKSQDKLRLDVLRFILSLIKYAEIEKQKDLQDTEIIPLLQKEVKKRKEAIEIFKKGGRTEGVENEEKQIAVIGEFMPERLSPDELDKIVSQVITTSGSSSQMRQIIGEVMTKVKGHEKGEVVAKIVEEKLQGV